MRYAFIFFFIIALQSSKAQNESLYWDLVANKKTNDHRYKDRIVTFLNNDKKPIIKYNPVNLIFGSMLFVYQKSISQHLGTSCPYELSCSEFSRKCIMHYGIFEGILLSSDRLMRCTPYTKIDIRSININPSTNKVIDPIENYRLKK